MTRREMKETEWKLDRIPESDHDTERMKGYDGHCMALEEKASSFPGPVMEREF